jgi:hypothetical protein
MIVSTSELRQDAKNFKREFLFRTFGATPQVAGVSQLSEIPLSSNIVGVGYGVKISGQTIVDDLALRVYVRSKWPKSQIPTNEQVPSEINGKLTDVIPVYDIQQPPMLPAMYQSVRKHGRTTGHTVGVIMDLAADIRVRFGQKLANFEEQLAIQGVSGLFSQGGDSGSLIVDAMTSRPVALLFAGGGNQTFACPIDRVLSRFDVDIL